MRFKTTCYAQPKRSRLLNVRSAITSPSLRYRPPIGGYGACQGILTDPPWLPNVTSWTAWLHSVGDGQGCGVIGGA
jgi:hypothetical protein